MRRIATPDGKVSVVIQELLAELDASHARGWFAGRPHHQHAHARLEKKASA